MTYLKDLLICGEKAKLTHWLKAFEQFMKASGEKQTVLQRLSPQSQYGNKDQGICPVAVYISLAVSASWSSQSIHYLNGYCTSPLS